MSKILRNGILFVIALAVCMSCPISEGEAAKYSVKLWYESDNLYKDLNSGIYFKTFLCMELSAGEEAIYDSDRQEIWFRNGGRCMVEKLLK